MLASRYACGSGSVLPGLGHFGRFSSWPRTCTLHHIARGCGRRLSPAQLRPRAARQRVRALQRRSQEQQPVPPQQLLQNQQPTGDLSEQGSISQAPKPAQHTRKDHSQSLPAKSKFGRQGNRAALKADAAALSEDAVFTDVDELWDEIGNESIGGGGPSFKPGRKAVPPGEYFTVVKNPGGRPLTKQQTAVNAAAAEFFGKHPKEVAEKQLQQSSNGSPQADPKKGKASSPGSTSSDSSQKKGSMPVQHGEPGSSKRSKRKAISTSSRESLFSLPTRAATESSGSKDTTERSEGNKQQLQCESAAAKPSSSKNRSSRAESTKQQQQSTDSAAHRNGSDQAQAGKPAAAAAAAADSGDNHDGGSPVGSKTSGLGSSQPQSHAPGNHSAGSSPGGSAGMFRVAIVRAAVVSAASVNAAAAPSSGDHKDAGSKQQQMSRVAAANSNSNDARLSKAGSKASGGAGAREAQRQARLQRIVNAVNDSSTSTSSNVVASRSGRKKQNVRISIKAVAGGHSRSKSSSDSNTTGSFRSSEQTVLPSPKAGDMRNSRVRGIRSSSRPQQAAVPSSAAADISNSSFSSTARAASSSNQRAKQSALLSFDAKGGRPGQASKVIQPISSPGATQQPPSDAASTRKPTLSSIWELATRSSRAEQTALPASAPGSSTSHQASSSKGVAGSSSEASPTLSTPSALGGSVKSKPSDAKAATGNKIDSKSGRKLGDASSSSTTAQNASSFSTSPGLERVKPPQQRSLWIGSLETEHTADSSNAITSDGQRPLEGTGRTQQAGGRTEPKPEHLKKQVSSGRKAIGSSKVVNSHSQDAKTHKAPSSLAPPTAEEQRTPGYYVKLLTASGHLPNAKTGRPGQYSKKLGLQINTCLIMTTTLGDMAYLIEELLPYMSKVNIATALNKLGKMVLNEQAKGSQVLESPAYKALTEKAVEEMPTMDTKHVINIMQGVAILKDESSALMTIALNRIAEVRMETLRPTGLAAIARAFGQLQGHPQCRVQMWSICQIMMQHMAGVKLVKCEILANVCWGLAQNALAFPEFLEATGHYIARKTVPVKMPSIITISWAFSKLRYKHEALMGAVPEAVLGPSFDKTLNQDSGLFSPTSFVTLMGGDRAMSSNNQPLLKALESEMSKPERLAQMSSQAMIDVAWCFATLRHYPAQFMDLLGKTLLQCMPDLRDFELATSMWVFGRLAHHPGQKFLQNLLQCVDAKVKDDSLSVQGGANILWGLGVFGIVNNSTAARVVEYISRFSAEQLGVGNLHQLFQAELLSRIDGSMTKGDQASSQLVVPPKLHQAAERSWKLTARDTCIVSAFHKDVSNVLKAMSVSHEIEHLTEDKLFSVDVAILEGKLAIEVDGPHHYTLNTNQPLGHTLLRRRILRSLGWKAASVPYFEWNPLGTLNAKILYMAKLLERHQHPLPESANSTIKLIRRFSGRDHSGTDRKEKRKLDRLLRIAHHLPSVDYAIGQQADSKRATGPAEQLAFALALAKHGSKPLSTDRASPLQSSGGASQQYNPAATTAEAQHSSPGAADPSLTRYWDMRTGRRADPAGVREGAVQKAPTASSGSSAASPYTHRHEPPAQQGQASQLDKALKQEGPNGAVADTADETLTTAEARNGSTPGKTAAATGIAASSAARVQQLRGMTLANELRPLCKQYSLPVSGTKQNVIDRILKHERKF